MSIRTLIFTTLLFLFITGCSTTRVSDSRVLFLEAREPNCALDFRQLDIQELSPMGEWDVVGYVTISEAGDARPGSEEHRKIVRPRACAMGGTAIAIMQSTTSSAPAALQTSSGIIYAVIRPKTTEADTPTAF